MKTLRLGDIRIDRIVEFQQPLMQPARLFPGLDPRRLDRHRRWLEPHLLDPETGMLVLSVHSFLIRTPDLTIIVDTCSGNHKPRAAKPRYHLNDWPFLERLRAAGVEPEQVDVVICTHLHVDHVGWNTCLEGGRWKPTFPKARYLLPRVEWEFCRTLVDAGDAGESAFVEDSLLPVFAAGQAELVEGDHVLNDAVWLEPAPGHAPGQVSVHVRSGGRNAVMCADIMHHPLQCAEPQLSSSFCHAPHLAAATRLEFLRRHAAAATLVLPAHFPAPTAGRIVSAADGFRFIFEEELR